MGNGFLGERVFSSSVSSDALGVARAAEKPLVYLRKEDYLFSLSMLLSCW